MLDERTTEQRDLRGGRTPWRAESWNLQRRTVDDDLRCGVLVVGAGITGSVVAEQLTRLGQDVVIIDRTRPGEGSTAASTAMLLWEIDRSLAELVEIYGFDRAASVYRRSLAATRGMVALIENLSLDCGLQRRNALYLAAPDVGETELRHEHALRTRAALPGKFLDHAGLHDEFEMLREAALLSPEAAQADPARLAQSLLQVAVGRGARLFDAEAVSYDSAGDAVGVQLDDGHCIEVRHVVLATGYVMPDILTCAQHRIVSSFAIATPPQRKLWHDEATIWEASENYLYLRTTAGGRIIAGGEDDEHAIEPEQRDALMPMKAAAIVKRLSALWPDANTTTEFIWSGAFGTTADGLPLIGKVPGHPRIHAAYGYGGNGITFSYLAAQMIGELIADRPRPWFDEFAIDRDPPKQL
jgi:glycine/D-amino acid oxidase-like deaminating enzyme